MCFEEIYSWTSYIFIIFVLNKDLLPELKETKFPIVEQISKIEIGNIPVTLSIGIGINGTSINEDMEFARGALDLGLSTIQSADVILVMKDGNIIEQGNHEQLMKKGGVYAGLYSSQFH